LTGLIVSSPLGILGFILPPFASFATLREVLRFWMNRERKRKSVRICGLFFSCLRLLRTSRARSSAPLPAPSPFLSASSRERRKAKRLSRVMRAERGVGCTFLSFPS
jgi:hypothetical protein